MSVHSTVPNEPQEQSMPCVCGGTEEEGEQGGGGVEENTKVRGIIGGWIEGTRTREHDWDLNGTEVVVYHQSTS